MKKAFKSIGYLLICAPFLYSAYLFVVAEEAPKQTTEKTGVTDEVSTAEYQQPHQETQSSQGLSDEAISVLVNQSNPVAQEDELSRKLNSYKPSESLPEPEFTCNEVKKNSELGKEDGLRYLAQQEAEVSHGLAINAAKRFYATCHSNTCDTSYTEMLKAADDEYSEVLSQIETRHQRNINIINTTCY